MSTVAGLSKTRVKEGELISRPRISTQLEMTKTRRALVFVNSGSGSDHLTNIFKEVDLAPLSPTELAGTSDPVSIIIIDRPAINAIAICSNLRRQDEFKDVPFVVLAESADPGQVAQLSNLGADLFFKPVAPKALVRYLTAKIPKAPEPAPGAPPTVEREVAPPSTPVEPVEEVITEPSLDDTIPDSNRLLAKRAPLAKVAKGGTRCGQCGRWRVRPEDAFCSKCGKALVVLKAPDKVTFEPWGNHRTGGLIELENTGQNPILMRFNVVADRQLAKRFTLHTNEGSLDGGLAEYLLSTFDARGLDLTINYEAVLEITSNVHGLSKQPVALVVERLAIPRLTMDDHPLFVLGAENEWKFRLSNDGGGTLALTAIRLVDPGSDSSESGADLEVVGKPVVKAGDAITVHTRVPHLDLSPGKVTKKIVCEFSHHKPLETNIVIEVIRPARLVVQPPELDFAVISTRRSAKLSLEFTNTGGEELVIHSVVPSAKWLDCSLRTPFRIEPGNTAVVEVQVHGSPEWSEESTGEVVIRSNSYDAPEQTIPVLVKFVEPAPYEAYVGIDFGTTASCVAVVDKNDQAFVIPLDSVPPGSQSDSRIMPSVIFFQADGSVIAGREALQDADIQPANAITSIKRVLGAKQKKTLAGREFDPTELTSKIIEQLMLRTEKALFDLGEYKTPQRAVVTVPVEIFDNQRRALVEACQMAGLEMHSSSKHGVVIDEAHAAALYYLSKKEAQHVADSGPERLLIFDFGGGTLDCALIEIEAAAEKIRLTTLVPFGDPRLGGDDIDWALVGLLADKAKDRYPDFDINCLGSEQKFNHHFRAPEIARAAYTTRARFKRQAELAKITLGKSSAVELTIGPLLRVGATPLESYIMNGTGPAHFEVTLSHEELESAVEPFLVRAAGVIETMCQRAGVHPEEIHTILHVGRTSLLPIVRERINSLLPEAEDRSTLIEPKLCVALGAAFWGQIKDQPHSNFEFVGATNRLIHDIGYIDFSTGMLRQVFVTVFPAQTQFPCEKTVELPLTKDRITLQLAENRGQKQVVDGNTEIRRTGRVMVDAVGVSSSTIVIKFAIDENRVLQITANGKTQNIELVDD